MKVLNEVNLLLAKETFYLAGTERVLCCGEVGEVEGCENKVNELWEPRGR